MKWSPQQDQALVAVADWLRDKSSPFFYLAGYAGSGKTTLAKYFADSSPGQTSYAAFTGKAAYVMAQKGCHKASTIHSLIYHPKEKCRVALAQLNKEIAALTAALGETSDESDEADFDEAMRAAVSASPEPPSDRSSSELARLTLRRRLRELEAKRVLERANLARPAFTLNLDSEVRFSSLIVIDECSMVDEQIGTDLLSFEIPILVLGDPAQLPPVGGGAYFTGQKPDFMLTEIHRQARGNPIIDLATRVRCGEGLPGVGSYGESRIVRAGSTGKEDALAADQFLVGRNTTRHAGNRRYRELLGMTGPWPNPGDKLVCLRNNHDLGLLNGSLWNTLECEELDDDHLYLSLKNDEGIEVECEAHTAHFIGTETTDLPWYERKEAEEFDFGYALTVHKAQGSQWGNVFLVDESRCFRQHAKRWAYTAITRAAEKITIVVP